MESRNPSMWWRLCLWRIVRDELAMGSFIDSV